MKKTICLFILFSNLIFISCFNKKNKEDEIIISQINKEFVQYNLEHKDQLIPHSFYYEHNFILTREDGVFYFYNKKHNMGSYGTTEFDNTNPIFLRLSTSDLIEINTDTLKLFINRIVDSFKSKNKITYISISTNSDTIINNSLHIFRECLNKYNKNKNYRFAYSYRLMTEEESVVLNAKKQKTKNNPDSITWKNKFGGIKFNVPNDKN